MRCHICDKSMTDQEIQIAPDGKTFEPCAVCMAVILETAYSDGFVKEEDLSVELGEDDIGSGAVEVLDDNESYRSVFDHCDAGYSLNTYGDE